MKCKRYGLVMTSCNARIHKVEVPNWFPPVRGFLACHLGSYKGPGKWFKKEMLNIAANYDFVKNNFLALKSSEESIESDVAVDSITLIADGTREQSMLLYFKSRHGQCHLRELILRDNRKI